MSAGEAVDASVDVSEGGERGIGSATGRALLVDLFLEGFERVGAFGVGKQRLLRGQDLLAQRGAGAGARESDGRGRMRRRVGREGGGLGTA